MSESLSEQKSSYVINLPVESPVRQNLRNPLRSHSPHHLNVEANTNAHQRGQKNPNGSNTGTNSVNTSKHHSKHHYTTISAASNTTPKKHVKIPNFQEAVKIQKEEADSSNRNNPILTQSSSVKQLSQSQYLQGHTPKNLTRQFEQQSQIISVPQTSHQTADPHLVTQSTQQFVLPLSVQYQSAQFQSGKYHFIYLSFRRIKHSHYSCESIYIYNVWQWKYLYFSV